MSALPWVEAALESAGINFYEIHHRPAYTAQEVAEKIHVSGNRLVKTVAVEVDESLVLLVLPASRRVCLDRVRQLAPALCARLLTQDEVAFYFNDCEVGAIPPLRHWPDIDIWMDSSLKTAKEISFSGGTYLETVQLPFEAWVKLVKPLDLSFSEPLESACADEEDDWRDH